LRVNFSSSRNIWSLITLLVLSSGPAYAEWVKVATSQSQGGYTGHIDPDTIRRNGDLVKMWQLYDFKTIQTFGSLPYLSAKIRSEYDCAEERWRLLALTNFSGNMGTGNMVSSNSHEGEWVPVQPAGISQIMWNFACDKP
jgi:hypothetical protein